MPFWQNLDAIPADLTNWKQVNVLFLQWHRSTYFYKILRCPDYRLRKENPKGKHWGQRNLCSVPYLNTYTASMRQSYTCRSQWNDACWDKWDWEAIFLRVISHVKKKKNWGGVGGGDSVSGLLTVSGTKSNTRWHRHLGICCKWLRLFSAVGFRAVLLGQLRRAQ